MIYTLTLNPSLDYTLCLPELLLGKTNRTTAETLTPGGKGINVSLALQKQGISSRALGFLAGFTGAEIRRRLEEAGLSSDFITVPGCSRINVKLQSPEGTEINGMGPEIREEDLCALLAQLEMLKPGDALVLSGSIPASLPRDLYGRILERIGKKAVLTLVDASGEALSAALSQQPFLIKPNRQELEELFSVSLPTRESAIPYARKLRELGAQNVLVSLSGDGAVLVTREDQVFSAPAPKGACINSVGAGDAMLAGFLGAWLESGDYALAFQNAIAWGSATAFSQGFPDAPTVSSLIKNST